jgi:O-antigen ligase
MVLWYERHGSPARWVGTAAVAGVGALLLASLVPHAMFLRATTFDPAVVGRGQDSLRNRLHTAVVGVRMAAEHPWLGVGIGNFVGLKRAYYGLPREQHVHNAYLWAVTSGGAGVLGLYLLLIGVAFRMLGVLERAGPREWLWLTRATRVNLVLFLTASAFADIWLNELFYLLVGLPAMMLTVAARTRAAHRVPTGMPARAAAAAPAPAAGAA